MQEQPVTGAVTPPEQRVDERTLDPFTLRVVANTMRAESAGIKTRLAQHVLGRRERLTAEVQWRVLDTYAGYLEGRAIAVESGQGRPS